MANKTNFKEESKFELFLYEILFGGWQLEIIIMKFIMQLLIQTALILSKVFLPKTTRMKFSTYLKKRPEETGEYLNNPTDGFCISNAIRIFEGCIFFYMMPLALIALGLAPIVTDNLEIGYIVGLISLFGIVCFMPNYHNEKNKRKYLRYFDRIHIYEDDNKGRYMRLALLFIIGAVLVFAMGIGLFF